MGGISNIYSMWGRSLWLQEKYSKLLLFDSHAACYAASFRVSLYPQPRALSILLWQWNCDDEPCLQGAFPQGQPHANKYTQHMRAHKHTVRVSSDHLFRHSTYLYIKNPWFGFSCFFLMAGGVCRATDYLNTCEYLQPIHAVISPLPTAGEEILSPLLFTG